MLAGYARLWDEPAPGGFVVERDGALGAVIGPVPVAALPEALSTYARDEATTMGVEYHHVAS